MLKVRPYQVGDQDQIEQMFYGTVHEIVSRDYSQEQIKLWVEQGKKNRISRPLEKSYAFVAEINGQIVGFGDITSEGYLDRLYVHKNFQRCGVASQLIEALESKVRILNVPEINAEVSITAKPFFLAKGFIIKEQQITYIENIPFINFKMSKKISSD